MLKGFYATAVGACVLVLALPASAAATEYLVDSTGDESDADTTNPTCETASGPCTLRAAIEQANANPGADEVTFDASFTGDVATDTIVTSGLLDINEDLTIDGGNCGTSSSPEPCAGVQASSGFSQILLRALADNSPDVVVRGLAVTGGFIGIESLGGTLDVEGSWFGLNLAGANGPNSEGIHIGPFTRATIGGDTPSERNVFANNGTGVKSFGDDGVISGNYFGTLPDGQTHRPNTRDVEIAGTTTSPAERNVIGGTPTAAQAASSQCDGPCNVLAGGTFRSVTFEALAGGILLPPGKTTIAGNFVGIDRTGSVGLHSDIDALLAVGDADDVTIGGGSPDKRNYIAGGTGITSTNGARALLIQNNFLGLKSTGNAALPFQGYGASLAKGRFVENRVAGTPSTFNGLRLTGNDMKVEKNVFGVTVSGTPARFGSAAIEIMGRNNTLGGASPDSGNLLGNPGAFTIVLIAGGDSNRLIGNRIGTEALGASGPGVAVFSDADGNKIGGNTAGEENVISGNGAGVRIAGNGSDQNRFFRNRGEGNDAIFFELSPPDGFGNDPNSGPNAGIQAPIVDFASQTSANGRSRPGAVIRLFRLFDDGINIRAFVGQTTANSNGDWSLTYPSIPNGTFVAASQTKSDSSSELSQPVRVR